MRGASEQSPLALAGAVSTLLTLAAAAVLSYSFRHDSGHNLVAFALLVAAGTVQVVGARRWRRGVTREVPTRAGDPVGRRITRAQEPSGDA